MTKEDILKRKALRQDKIVITQVNIKNESHNSFFGSLSPLQSWELLAKISREMFYIQTGVKPNDSVDKHRINIIQQDH